MKTLIFTYFLILIIFFGFPLNVNAEKDFNFYINDFYSKQNKVRKILREIEIDLKNGSRNNVCSRQRDASKLALMANKSLLKAYEMKKINPPIKVLKASQKIWEDIKDGC